MAQLITQEVFEQCLQFAKAEGWQPARLEDDSLLGTVIARIAWEKFNLEIPEGVRCYCDQVTTHQPLPAANAVYGAQLRAAYLVPRAGMTEAQLIARISEIDKNSRAGIKRGQIVKQFRDLAAEAIGTGMNADHVFEVFKRTADRAQEQLNSGEVDATTPYKL
jgi:hypothetical protein